MKQENPPRQYIARFEDHGLGLTDGPDAEDLICSLEERFGIVLADDETEAVRTPGQLVDLIMTKVESIKSTDCLSQRAFYLIRRVAIRSFLLPRRAIAPETKLGDIVPSKFRYARWKSFGTNIGAAKWPDLQRSRPVFATLVLLATAAFCWCLRCASDHRRASFCVGLSRHCRVCVHPCIGDAPSKAEISPVMLHRE